MAVRAGQKIAVIGSGIAGLSAAWRLSLRHDVTLFEAADRPGGHAHTVRAEIGGQAVDVDTGNVGHQHRHDEEHGHVQRCHQHPWKVQEEWTNDERQHE